MPKTKKTILLLGATTIVSASIAIPLVSCGSDGNSSKPQKDTREFKGNDISREKIAELGGISSDKFKENNYALLQDVVYSLQKGAISKFLTGNGLIAKAVPQLGKIWKKIQALDPFVLFDSLKIIVSKGLSIKKPDELQPIMKVVGAFVSTAKKAEIESYIELVVGFLNSENAKSFIKAKGGVFSLLKKLLKVLPDFVKPVFTILENGTENKTLTQILETIVIGLKNIIANENVKRIVGAVDNSNQRSLIDVLKNKVLVDADSFWSTNSNDIETSITEYDNVQDGNDEDKKTAKEFTLAGAYFKQVKTRFEENKKLSYIKDESTIPAFNNKGLLNSTKGEFTKNIIFLQSVIQKFLLYFGRLTWDSNTRKWISSADEAFKEAEKIISGKESELDEIKSQVKSILNSKELWLVAKANLTQVAPFLHKLLANNILKLNINSQESTQEFNAFFNFILTLLDKSEVNLRKREINALLKIVGGGLASVANSIEDKKGIDKALSTLMAIFISNDKLQVSITPFIKSFFFGSSK